jgi:hypothetical protein
MPNASNRVKSFPWAFNEVSWLDILNGYAFKFERVKVSPADRARAQQALQQVSVTVRQGIDPRSFMPIETGVRGARLSGSV